MWGSDALFAVFKILESIILEKDSLITLFLQASIMLYLQCLALSESLILEDDSRENTIAEPLWFWSGTILMSSSSTPELLLELSYKATPLRNIIIDPSCHGLLWS